MRVKEKWEEGEDRNEGTKSIMLGLKKKVT